LEATAPPSPAFGGYSPHRSLRSLGGETRTCSCGREQERSPPPQGEVPERPEGVKVEGAAR